MNFTQSSSAHMSESKRSLYSTSSNSHCRSDIRTLGSMGYLTQERPSTVKSRIGPEWLIERRMLESIKPVTISKGLTICEAVLEQRQSGTQSEEEKPSTRQSHPQNMLELIGCTVQDSKGRRIGILEDVSLSNFPPIPLDSPSFVFLQYIIWNSQLNWVQ